MPFLKSFKFNFNLTSKNDLQLGLSENNTSPVYITGAYKTTGEEFFGFGSYGETTKKITPDMVKLPPVFQPDPTDPDVIKASKSTGDLTQAIQTQNLPPNLRKSTPQISTNPGGSTTNNRQSTDLRNTNMKDVKNKQKDQKNLDKKRLAEQKKQEKIAAQQRAKEEKLRKEREKAEQKEQAKQEKLRIQREKAEAAKAKKQKVPQKKATNPLAQGPNAPLPYSTNTLQSSISKASGPPAYEESKPIDAKNLSTTSSNSEVVQNENDNTGNTSFGAPIDSGSTWDMVAQHRVQVSRVPIGASKVGIKLQETAGSDSTAVTGRKSLYV